MILVECVGAPFIYRWPDGEVRLAPGHPVELPDDRAARLLAKAGGRVRVVASSPPPPADIVLEPAHPNPRPVYWERADGSIVGPGTPEFLARVGESFWVIVQFESVPVWVNASSLRSKQAFDTQSRATGKAET
ncbi:MAG: hypothetical protein SGJ16_08760 [Nitrospirota bacterium]|nr:hypothetical protein [Nitrospirota bacterium]